MQARQRKRQRNPRAAAGAVAYFDVTSVRPRDRMHKRQSQSVPTGMLTSDEALKHAVPQFGREARSIVFDNQMGLTMALVNTYLDAAPGGNMAQLVVQQVRQGAVQQRHIGIH